MNKNKNHISLLQDFLHHRKMSSSELKLLFKLYNSEKGQAGIKDELEEYWSSFPCNTGTGNEVDSEKMKKAIFSVIRLKRHFILLRYRQFYQWTTAAAAVLLVALLISAAFFLDISLKNKGNMASLSEVVAPAGSLKKYQLPDGTKVWLSPGSSMIYSEDMLTQKIRDVRLWGQAYFEVAKNLGSPFVLQLGDIGLKVTGTRFNASNYKDDPYVEVYLERGAVRLFEGNYAEAEDFIQIEPGQLAHYQKGSQNYKIEKVNGQKYTSWIRGILMFRDDQMSDVFRCMERWYNVKIVVENPRINNYRYTATIKSESLEKILQLIEYTSHLDCDLIQGNKQDEKQTVLITNKK
ncbi:MAG: FecR family protein [Mangrovibacterium sp.]